MKKITKPLFFKNLHSKTFIISTVWKLAVINFSYVILISCFPYNETAHSEAEKSSVKVDAYSSRKKQSPVSVANRAIENIRQHFANLSKEQMQIIREVALKEASQIAKNTATQIAVNVETEAVENLEKQLAILSESQKQAIKKDTLDLANQVAEDIATQISTSAVSEAITNMEDQFTDKTQDIEDQYSALLKAGLRTIISAAIEATVVATYNHESIVNQEEVVDQVKDIAVNVAEKITLTNNTKQVFSLPFEECNWTNLNYTSQLIKDHSFFPLSDPLKSMIEEWDHFKTNCNNSSEADSVSNRSCVSENDQSGIEVQFAYLSPLYDDFVLSFLKDTIKDTYFSEADIPLECFFASSIKGANIYTPSSRNFYYCERDSSRRPEIQMTVIDDKEQTRHISPRRACLNRDYIYLTARAFNKTADCFGFNKSQKESIFKLFNHESSFLHNVKSPKGAKCYGQLTTVSIKEINKQIYFSDSETPLAYSYIFNEVIEKCPGLQEAVLNPKIYESAKNKRKSMRAFNKMISQFPISCKVTQNPYSCLFYAFYNIRINSVAIELQLTKETTTFSKQYDIPQEFKEYFLLPISLNEMVGVTNNKGRDMIFWDDSEVWQTLNHYPLDHFNNIRKLPLFENEKEVRDLFNFWAYNGGVSIPSDYMTEFIKNLKISIATPCPPDFDTKICQYRFTIASGKGLKTEDIKRDFQEYIRSHYITTSDNPDKRRREVAFFTNNISSSLNYLYNKKGLFKSHLKKLLPGLENEEISDFQDYLKKVCPQF